MKNILVVGAGFFGTVLAERLASLHACSLTVIDKRNHIGGNCWSEVDAQTGVECHMYGSHIFHTSNKNVWDYLNRFSSFNNYRHTVWTISSGKVYPLPISLATINSFYGLSLSPLEARHLIEHEARKEGITAPANLEEKAVSLIGRPLYEAFIKGYTIKQWEKDPKELSENIINRLPVRYDYNTRYFSDRYEGIPLDGYGNLFRKMLEHEKIAVRLGTSFRNFEAAHTGKFDLIIYSGAIDEFFDYQLGALEWRTVEFEVERHDCNDVQGISVMNYADSHVPYTRIHEFKHYHPERPDTGKSITFKEFSRFAKKDDEPYYPVDTEQNRLLLNEYKELAKRQAPNVIFGGRLGGYCYYDMDNTIAAAFKCLDGEILPRLDSVVK